MQEEMKNCRKYAPKMIKYRDLAGGAARLAIPEYNSGLMDKGTDARAKWRSGGKRRGGAGEAVSRLHREPTRKDNHVG